LSPLRPLAARLDGYDQRKLVAQYDRFLDRSKLRDDDRVLVEPSARALAELAQCVATPCRTDKRWCFASCRRPSSRCRLQTTARTYQPS
jgi:hypothetical protein